ncbi:hypothetical protein J6590_004272 [Homalodisca vitripennis]|nr:hypothetical protein J6590_004272 [Homalodisca vitripennis]
MMSNRSLDQNVPTPDENPESSAIWWKKVSFSYSQHHSYEEAVISRPAGQSTDLNPKERQSGLNVQKYESGFLGPPSTSAGLN